MLSRLRRIQPGKLLPDHLARHSDSCRYDDNGAADVECDWIAGALNFFIFVCDDAHHLRQACRADRGAHGRAENLGMKRLEKSEGPALLRYESSSECLSTHSLLDCSLPRNHLSRLPHSLVLP